MRVTGRAEPNVVPRLRTGAMRGPVGDYFHDGHGVSDQQHIGEKVQTTGLTDAAVDQLGVVAAALRKVTIKCERHLLRSGGTDTAFLARPQGGDPPRTGRNLFG